MIDIASDPLIGIKEVARRFGCTNESVRRWIRTGRLDGRMCGGQWFTTAEALNDMARRETAARVQREVSLDAMSLSDRRTAAAVAARQAQVDQARLAVARESGVAALARHGVLREG